MILSILRGIFMLLAATVTALYVLPFQQGQELDFQYVVVMMAITLGVAAVVIAVDVLSPRKRLSSISGVFLGLMAGLLAAYALSFVVDLVGLLTPPVAPVDGSSQALRDAASKTKAFLDLLQGVKVFIGLITCYVGITLVLQTKDDFRFVIPYIEFAKETRGQRPTLLDTSVIIDGRIVELVRAQFAPGVLVVPRFVVDELQALADSADKLKRARGRRGLDVLQKLQSTPAAGLTIEDVADDLPGNGVDQKLLATAERTHARLMTNDVNLAKVAALRKVDVLSLNDLAAAMRPVMLPGESLRLRISKAGEGAAQGVGYLDDGTMVVVEGARQMVGQEVELTVTSSIQTSAGRMIFGKVTETSGPAGGGPARSGPAQRPPG